MYAGTQFGDYCIDSFLGKGGMAEVYKVWHGGAQRYYALKKLPAQTACDHAAAARFLEEAYVAESMRHHHIAAVYDVGNLPGAEPYFVMELLEDGDLASLLKNRGRFSLEEALPLLRQIAEALDFIHQRGLVHCDVKPANILLSRTDDHQYLAKLADFGIARRQPRHGGTLLVRNQKITGTPEYMSPEQSKSSALIDRYSDQYSLAIIAYEMLCGRPPFQSEGSGSSLPVIMKQMCDEPLAPRVLIPGLSPRANDAIMKALAKNPSARFDSCTAFIEALSKSLSPRKTHHTFQPFFLMLGIFLCIGFGLISLGLASSGSQQATPGDGYASSLVVNSE
jgi:serine/threonine-protein kinase